MSMPLDPIGIDMLAQDELQFFAPALTAIGRLAYTAARSKGFRPEVPDSQEALRALLPREIALQHSELSEVLEADRKGNPVSIKIPEFSSIEEEYADVIIRVLETCAARGLNIGGAVAAKMAYNAGRPHKHGGKAY